MSKGKGKGKGSKGKGSKKGMTSDDYSKGKGGKGKGGTTVPAPTPISPVTMAPVVPVTMAPVVPVTQLPITNPVTPPPTPVPTVSPTPQPTTTKVVAPQLTPQPTDTKVVVITAAPTPRPAPVTSAIVDCDAIAQGTAPMTGTCDNFSVRMNLSVQSGFDEEEVFEAVSDELQKEVAPRIADCPNAQPSQRKLESVTVTSVLFGVPAEDTTASCDPPANSDSTCFPTDTDVTVCFVSEESRQRFLVERSELESKLEEELKAAAQNLQVPGLADLSGVDATRVADVSNIEDQPTSTGDDDGIGPGGIVAVAAASLVVVLLVLCLVVRRRRRGSVASSFRPFEDDDDWKDEDTTYYDREVEVVGDEDGASIASVWTGKRQQHDDYDSSFFTASKLARKSPSSNVHRCNSATCEVCETQRKNDVTFISTGQVETPTPRIPRDAERQYMATNSVML